MSVVQTMRYIMSKLCSFQSSTTAKMPNNRHILLNLNLHGRRYKTQIKKKVGSGHKRKGDSQTNTTSKSQSKNKKLF